jgi:hypothetical protein
MARSSPRRAGARDAARLYTRLYRRYKLPARLVNALIVVVEKIGPAGLVIRRGFAFGPAH